MKKKTILSLLLLVFSVSLLSITAFAETSGPCGENLNWEYDKTDGVLTISGYGAMTDYDYVPWMDYRAEIAKVVIEDGCTSIGRYAFSGCYKLQYITLPPSVSRIGYGAFNRCQNLQDPVLDYVAEIDQYAFSGCSSLTTLKIPAGVTKINRSAFSDCHNLKEIIFHDNVTEIDYDAFSGCNKLTSIVIPDSVTYIGGSAFSSCSNLKTVDFGNGVTRMDNGAFSSCRSLETISLSDKLTKLSSYTFSGCTALREVYLGAGLCEVEALAFNHCTNLTAFTLSSENTTFFLAQGVLYSVNPMALIMMPPGYSSTHTIPNGATKIGYYSCYGAGVTALTVPETVTIIDDYALTSCRNLKTIILPEGLKEIRLDALSETAIESITIPSTVTDIGGMAFDRCTSLKEIVFKGVPPKIGDTAFPNVEIKVYFPGHIAEWAEAQRLYGGSPEWIPDCTLGHTLENVPGTAPGCTTPGKTDGSICRFCHNTVVEQAEIPALKHRFTEWVVTQTPTTGQEGKEKRSCLSCDFVEERVLEKLVGETEPPVTEPPVTEPPVTEPPVTEPPVTEPSATEPPAIKPELEEYESNPTTVSSSMNETEQDDSVWESMVIVVCILLVGAGIGFLLLKKKFRF